MEYIHKAKAEKNRTKVLTDQMEARRVKNKVCYNRRPSSSLLTDSSLRLPANAVQTVRPKSARNCLLGTKRQLRSERVSLSHCIFYAMHVMHFTLYGLYTTCLSLSSACLPKGKQIGQYHEPTIRHGPSSCTSP